MKLLRSAALAALVLMGWSRAGSDNAAPTFTKDIAPIVFNNCANCHRTGEVAPFSLQTYDDVKKRSKQIVRVTQDRYMPPWKAEPGYGDFLDSRHLTVAQLATLKAWHEAGAPEGKIADLPAMPKFPEGWPLGEPDLILKMPEACNVPAEGRDIYRAFVFDLDLKEDMYVQAIEFRPSNRKVVHHALFFLDTTGQARKKDEADKDPGFKTGAGPGFIPTGSLGGWAPGGAARRLPENTGRLMQKGSDVVVQLHFHPSGKIEQEQSTIGIYYAKKKPEKLITTIPLRSRKLDIPAGDKAYKVRDSFTSPIDIELVGVSPHAHLICKDMKGTLTLPDGKTTPLIWIKDWDFNWQEQYLYKEPLQIPKGSKLEMEFTYDNSADNIRNPNTPPKRVTWGEQTTDEMALLFLQVTPKNAAEGDALKRDMIARLIKSATEGGLPAGLGGAGAGGGKRGEMLKEMMKQYDKDGDGKLNAEEQAEATKKLKELLGR